MPSVSCDRRSQVNIVPMFLRQIPVGGRFLLLRTGEKHLRTDRHGGWGWSASNIPAVCERTGKATTLHHSCHVKRVIRWGSPDPAAKNSNAPLLPA